MKKLIITLLILLGIGAVAFFTCPDRQAHKEAIMSVVNESINDELHTDDKDAQALSAGVFGYVFTFGKEDLKKALNGQ